METVWLIYREAHCRDRVVAVAATEERANQYINSRKYPGEYYTEQTTLLQ